MTCIRLQLACQKGAYDCAVLLLAAKADATHVKRGEPPLFYAVATENSALGTQGHIPPYLTPIKFPVRRLLEAGADVGQPNQAGQTLMEVLNPKCEIYRVIKQFLADRPGGQVRRA